MWKDDREENKNPTKGELQNQLPLWKMHLQNEICFLIYSGEIDASWTVMHVLAFGE